MEKGIALILQIALDTPLRRVFDYLPPADTGGGTPKLGVRVSVPFGRRQLIGVLVGITQASSIAPAKLSKVDFPQPLRPTSATNSPRETSKDKLLSARTGCPSVK